MDGTNPRPSAQLTMARTNLVKTRAMGIWGPITLLVCVSLLTACASPTPITAEQGDRISIAAEIQAFWEQHGGSTTLGDPIGALEAEGSTFRQTFLNVELIYDPLAPSTSRVSLAPVGRAFSLAEPPIPPPDSNYARYFPSTGHTLYPSFVQTYEQLGGASVLGAPIAEVEIHDGLIVQYFENAGFYTQQDDPDLTIRLIAFGPLTNPERRVGLPNDEPLVTPAVAGLQPFSLFLERLGGGKTFGRPLGEPYLTEDAAIEQVYENAVLYAPPGPESEIRLRPVIAAMSPADPPVPKVEDPDALYFPETGHNVQWAFASFYRSVDGKKLLGLPLEEAKLRGDALSQRFENVELLYRFDMPPHLAVQLANIGQDYLEKRAAAVAPESVIPTPIPPRATPSPEPQQITVKVLTWVAQTALPVGETQQVSIRVLHQDDTAWSGVAPILVVHGPRQDVVPPAPETDDEGISRVSLTLEDIQPGEIVNYEVAIIEGDAIGYASGQFIANIGSEESR